MVSPFVRQAWAVSAVLMNMIAVGLVVCYPSSLLPGLQREDSNLKPDVEMASWIASCNGISGIAGFLSCAYAMDRFGRRATHGVILIPGALGWLVIYFAPNLTALLIGRMLCGLTGGGTVILGAIIVGEFTSPKYRGLFLAMKTTAGCVGNSLQHVLGHYLHWRTIALVSLIPNLLVIVINCTWPESPAWLASKKRFDESRKAFRWLRGNSKEANNELEAMISAQERITIEEKSFKTGMVDLAKKFKRRDFVIPLTIMIFASLLLETCGRHLFPAYAQQILNEMTGNASQSFFFTLAIDVITTVTSVFASGIISMVKRRTVLFVSGAASVAMLSSISLYLYLAAKGTISNDRPLVPLSMLVMYFVLSNLGCNPIPLALMGEIFPLAHKSAGTWLSGVMLSLSLITVLKSTPIMLINLKIYGTFALLSGAMAVCLGALYFVLPETKDKTLQDIEDHFNRRKTHTEDAPEDGDVKMKMLG